MTTSILVTGASGRMGTAILNALVHNPKTRIAGASDLRDAVGKDVGDLLPGQAKLGIIVQASLQSALKQAHKPHAIIDFTAPEATIEHLKTARAFNVPLVIGSTGFSPAQKQIISRAAKKIPIVLSPNMSVGVNALFQLIADAVQVLGEGYDLEVIEAHHRLKKDAPSGTAVRIGEILAEASGRAYPRDARFHREGLIGARPDREIGMQTIRGGDIVGEHTVMYCGAGERLEIRHVATSRDTFALGAIRAAIWCASKRPGLYSMQDVLGLSAENKKLKKK